MRRKSCGQFNTLGEACAAVLSMRDEGMSYEQIGVTLGLRPKSAEAYASRARDLWIWRMSRAGQPAPEIASFLRLHRRTVRQVIRYIDAVRKRGEVS